MRFSPFFAALAATIIVSSCLGENSEVGASFIDDAQSYDTYVYEFPLEEISLQMADSLSGYSYSRIVIGSIYDPVYGLTRRESAFTLLPALDTLDLGKDPVPVKMDLHFALDTVSVADESQKRILQNVYAYELTDSLRRKRTGTSNVIAHSSVKISEGIPVINGSDSLSIVFTDDFARKWVSSLQEMADADGVFRGGPEGVTIRQFLAKLPGIMVTTDDPVGEGGRINLFSLSCLSVSSGYYYRNGNEALLTINSEYDGVRKDTTFLLLPGEMEWLSEASYINDNSKFYQYAFNSTIHSTKPMTGLISEHDNKIYVEGGGGLKPVISAAEIRNKLGERVSALGRDPGDIIINKASLILPFEAPEYTRFEVFPSILSPTCMIENYDGTFTFAGLTDASISTENQGDLNRSTCVYAPDISFHVQEILKLTNEEKLPGYDVWLLNVHSETEANASGSIYDSDYYRQLMYASYYNSLYGDGYGYGGYGYGGYGYGGYGYNSYSNYYSYMMLAQMYANSSSSSDYTTTTELDKDRYYQAVLNGVSEDLLASPRLKVILSVPKR